jgi:chromosomal replication initiator protein
MIDIKKYSEIAGISIADLESKSRLTEIVIRRQVYWYYLKQHGLSYTEIGRMFKKEHATVMYGVKKIIDLIEINDPYVKIHLEFLSA